MIRNILIIAVVCLLAMACAAQDCDRENEINSIRAQRDAGVITKEQAVLLTDMERQAWTACNLAALQANTAAFEKDKTHDVAFPDGSKGGVLVQNSWGSCWGLSAPGRNDRGCYWMPYAYFADHVSDAWMMHEGPAWK